MNTQTNECVCKQSGLVQPIEVAHFNVEMAFQFKSLLSFMSKLIAKINANISSCNTLSVFLSNFFFPLSHSLSLSLSLPLSFLFAES